MYKLVGTQLSLFTTFHVLFFQFVFVLPARFARMRNFTEKSKQMEAVNRTHKKTKKKKKKLKETKHTQQNEISDGVPIAICTTKRHHSLFSYATK